MNLVGRPFLDHDPAASHRTGGAAVSIALHGTILLVVIAAFRAAPDIAVSDVAAFVPPRTVWIPSVDAGGGRFGAPDRAVAPLRRMQVVGNQAASVPAPSDVSDQITNNAPEDIPSIPARPMGDSFTALPGAINGQSASDALGAGNPLSAGNGDRPGSGFGEGVRTGGPGVTTPTLIRQVTPRYTADAMRMRIQGSVWIECVVMPDGTVGDARIMRSLDARFGLDDEALIAARQWRFRPGTLYGRPVPVVISIELMFSVR